MPIILDMPQYSLEWYQAIAGNPGASSIDKIITPKGERSKQRDDFMCQLAGERITGKPEETFQSLAMQKGKEREPAARALFEMTQGVEVKKVGIVYKDEKKMCHCSPDGLIGENAGIEIKNPLMKTHVKYLLSGKLPMDYFCQLQMSLYVTEREKWFFMTTYEALPPLIIEVKRDEEFIKKLDMELNQFNAELLEMVKKIK